MAKGIITTTIDVLKKLKADEAVVIKFKKKDGTIRIMKCTLDFNLIPKKDKPKGISLEKILKLIETNKILHVYDLEKQGWRSIPLKEVEWMDIPSDGQYAVKIR